MKPSLPKLLLHAEGLAVLAIACGVYARADFSWGVFAATLLLPDLSMLGYLANHRAGALAYNLAHTYLAPLALTAVLYVTGQDSLLWIPLVWTSHIGMDRALGFGLKYPTAFKDSHLTRV